LNPNFKIPKLRILKTILKLCFFIQKGGEL
jgi:hypothetical protein